MEMTDYLHVTLTPAQVNAISNLGLAHVGDGVYELLCRSFLCTRGDTTVQSLHHDTVELVRAPAQSRFVDGILPLLTEQERAYYRRGKNSHVHAVPKGATHLEYARATGLETLFGALFLLGQTQRINELFIAGMEVLHGV